MIVSLIRTVYFLRFKAENKAVTYAGHDQRIVSLIQEATSEDSNIEGCDTAYFLV